MNRKDYYFTIKANGWVNDVKVKYGKNFTNCTTEQLKSFIEEKKVLNTKKEKVSKNKSNKDSNDSGKSPFDTLIAILAKKHILLPSEISFILN